MRFPRVKVTIRSLMVAVAAMALVFALGVWRKNARLRSDYLTQAAWHAQEERHWMENLARGRQESTHNVFAGATYDYDNAAMAAFNAQMNQAYERAAARPWEELPPLPPYPQMIRMVRRPPPPNGIDRGRPVE